MTSVESSKGRIASAFAGGSIFIPFVTCGDPDIETTKELVRRLSDAGAGIIELGIPFSDPTAEGPVIQAANERALSAGLKISQVFQMVEDLRAERIQTPFVFMTYANVVHHFGIDEFAQRCLEAGIDGLILPDVPFEEKAEFAPAFEERGLSFISMIAPTSEERIAKIASDAKGFIYLVSSLGVTGVRSKITTDLGSIVEDIRKVTDVPVAIGFGISTPEQAREMTRIADGAIVGSAIVRVVEEKGVQSPDSIEAYAKQMVEACSSK